MYSASVFPITLPFPVKADFQRRLCECVCAFKRVQVNHSEQVSLAVAPRRRNQHSTKLADVEVGYTEAKAIDAVVRSNNLQSPYAIR